MSLQNSIIEKFNQTFSNPPLRVIASKTGIHMSRVFRIINGSSMKLEEYLSFKSCIDEELGMKSSFLELAEQCEVRLGQSGLAELVRAMERRLSLKDLMITVKSNEAGQLTA